jgi:Family of unknown function (DUF5829)
MRSHLLFVSLLSVSVYAQKAPIVNFNHLFIVIDSTDLHALQKSSFIKNKFAALLTRTTKADSADSWTGTYLEGLDNYLELLEVGVNDPLGNAGIAFSVDRIGEISQLDAVLSRNYTTEIHLREKQYDNKKVPWFTALTIKDPVFDSLSHISFWVMEYKPEYFDYNHWKYKDDKLTRTTYLSQYKDERRDKILKRFTGASLRATEKERQVLSEFLLNCGYQKMTDGSLVSPEHFVIHFMDRKATDRNAVASIDFETNIPLSDDIKISANVEFRMENTGGKICFN